MVNGNTELQAVVVCLLEMLLKILLLLDGRIVCGLNLKKENQREILE